MGKQWNQWHTLFWAPKSLQMVTAAMKLKDFLHLGRKDMTNLDYILKSKAKGDQSWIFIGRTDAEAETPVLWPPDTKSWLIWKDPDAGKDWGQEEKGTTEDEMVGWHHRHNGHGFGWTPGVGDGQGVLVCCGSWGHKESDTTEQLNWLKWTDDPAIPFLGIHTE